jgi:transglutaminase-like putative cysteine protease
VSASAVAAAARATPGAARPSVATFSPVAAVTTFAALAAFSALHWASLLSDPPLGRIIALVAIATGAAGALALAGSAGLRRPARLALGATIALASAIAALLAAGLPVDMLDPADWGTLRANLDNGLAGITADIEFPYAGRNEWSRLALMLGLAIALVLAAALAFWPRDRGAESAAARPRLAALSLLVGIFAFAVIAEVRDGELLRGLALCALIAAWLWLPTLGRRDLLAGAAVIGLAAALALPAATRLDAAEPWFDYEDWSWAAGDKSVAFNWNHEYGSIDWPREGTTLFEVISDRPHYWRAVVLDRFDGVRWLQSDQITQESLEVPTEVEGADGLPQASDLEHRWIEQIGFRIDGLRSNLVVGAGAIQDVEGLEGVIPVPDGTVLSDEGPLIEGSAYAIQAYVPEPGERRLRAAPAPYAPSLARYTEIEVPLSRGSQRENGELYPTLEVEVPLRGERGEELREAGEALRRSRYAETYRLARRLTAGSPTAFDAVRGVEAYLKRRYTYSEVVAGRDYPLPAFLFEDRIGYCQQFSGAMALMLRMVGIPARVTGGFSPGAPIREQPNHYRVEDYDAHSWVEVWFNGIGWVAFDPTPAAAPANLQSSGPYRAGLAGTLGGVGRNPSRVRAFGPDRRRVEPPAAPAERGPDLSFFPPLLALFGVAGLGTLGWRALRYRRLTPELAAEAQVRELEAALRRLGWETSGGTTLRELHERFQLFGKSAASRYVSKLAARRYSSRHRGVPTLAERRGLRRDLARGGLRSRLRALRALPPGGPAAPRRPCRPTRSSSS